MRRELTGPEDLDAFAGTWLPTSEEIDQEPPAAKISSVSDVRSVRDYAGQKIDYALDHVFALGTISALSGESGSGKTTVAAAACSAIERGVPFAGIATSRRPVLYLDRENPLSVVVERFDRLGINDSPNFKYWGGWVEDEAPHPGGAIVLEWVKACEPKPVIVVDSLVGFLNGDENSSQDIRKFFNPLRRIADAGATVIVVHHSGKGDSSREYRGSSDIKGAIDVGYHVANLGDPSRLTTVRLKTFKARFTVFPELILNYTDRGFQADTRPAYVSVSEALTTLLRANPGSTKDSFEALAKDKGISRTASRDFLSSGHLAGTIHIAVGERNSKFHTWADDASEELL